MNRDKLLAAHLFYDFNVKEWNEKSQENFDPFKIKIFRNFPTKFSAENWGQALDRSRKISLKRICFLDPEYPECFLQLEDPPPVIYVMGNYELISPERSVAIVGTRACSERGIFATRNFAHFFAENGVCVVSGFAKGVDSEAHQSALDARGNTIAVLGSSVTDPYPSENQILLNQIVNSGGLIISPFPPGTHTNQYFFPRRNPLIALLSKGVLVTEAPMKSGAQLTARFALSQSMAVSVLTSAFDSPEGKGAISLLQIGAWPVSSPYEAMQSFGFSPQTRLNLHHSKKFTLSDFVAKHGIKPNEAIAVIQKLLHSGELEIVENHYRFTKLSQRKNPESSLGF